MGVLAKAVREAREKAAAQQAAMAAAAQAARLPSRQPPPSRPAPRAPAARDGQSAARPVTAPAVDAGVRKQRLLGAFKPGPSLLSAFVLAEALSPPLALRER
jgi:hypothetical protein